MSRTVEKGNEKKKHKTEQKINVPINIKNSEVFRVLLTEWLDLIDKYTFPSDGSEFDVPYWYGERALAGFLASATWRIKNSWALEEFTAERGDKKGNSKGRGDLWLSIGGVQFTIEAKICWPKNDIKSAIISTRDKLNEAKLQLHSLKSIYQIGIPYSVCYVVPYPKKTDKQNDFLKNVAALENVANQFASENCVVAKYAFVSSPPEDYGRIYPGVVFIAREEKWKK